MNKLTVREERSIEQVTTEIQTLIDTARKVVLLTAVEIGRRLVEAKELLPYGEWGSWLKERVEFSQVTATRYMKLFEEYGDKQGCLFGAETEFSTLKNLSVSNALSLLAVPAEERESFAADHDVENLSAREMDKLMKQLKEATAAAEEAEKKAKEAEGKLTAAEENVAAGTAALTEKKALERQLEDLQKKLAMSDAAVTRFKTLFEQTQSVFNSLVSALGDVTDEETHGKLRLAAEKLVEAFGQRVAG